MFFPTLLALLLPARALAGGCTSEPFINGTPPGDYDRGLSFYVAQQTDGVNDCTLTLLKNGQDTGFSFVFTPDYDDEQYVAVPSELLDRSTSSWGFSNEIGVSNSIPWPDNSGPIQCTLEVGSFASVASGGGYLAKFRIDTDSVCGPINYNIIDYDGQVVEEGQSRNFEFTTTVPQPEGQYTVYIDNRDVDTFYAYPADYVSFDYFLEAPPSGCTAVATVDSMTQTGRTVVIAGSALNNGEAVCKLSLVINGETTSITYDSTTDDFSFTIPNTLISASTAAYAVSNTFGTSNSVDFAPTGSLEPVQCTITITGVQTVSSGTANSYYARVNGVTQPECGPLDYSVFGEHGFPTYYTGSAPSFGFTTTNALPAGSYGVAVSNNRVDRNIARPAEVKLWFFQLAEPSPPPPEPSVCDL